MKLKLLLVAFLFFAFGIRLFAQNVSIGAKVGWYHSWMNVTSVDYVDNFNSFSAGVLASYKLNKSLSLRSELLYTRRGYSVDNGYINDVGILKDVDVELDYLNIPLMIEYYPMSFLYFHAGPSMGIQIGREIFLDKHKESDNLFGKKQWFDVGLILGAGLKYKGLFMEVQYSKGFLSAFRGRRLNDSFKTNSMLLSLGFLIFNKDK